MINIPEETTIELNDRFRHALEVMEASNRNVFVTGRAGTGKSTLLQYFMNNTKKSIAVLAPTGVAAVNIQGQTIHSFFNFKPDITPDGAKKIKPRHREIYKKLDTVVIDEISMVRADLLDCVDIFLRRYGRKKAVPFGGIQMVFIGDLYQLPPVVTARERALFEEHYKSPYFFDANVFHEYIVPSTGSLLNATTNMEFIELEKVYRQQDRRFLDILNAIRNNTAGNEDLDAINQRCMPEFAGDPGDMYISLTTTNALAGEVNSARLAQLKGDALSFGGMINGDFDMKALPTALDLEVKKGAQVMLLNNDSLGRWINGSIGTIADIEAQEDGADVIWVELSDGEVVDVLPYKWEMYEFAFDKKAGCVVSEGVGSFTQYPLKLAWAVTIHKSQGMTFDRVIIDIGRGTFSHGQLYVALSRSTTLEGIVLKKPVRKSNILMDGRVVRFVTGYQYRQAEERQPVAERISIIDYAIKENKKIEILYLKAGDEKSKRVVIPARRGMFDYRGRKFSGLQAFCTKRNSDRVFHLERILEMRVLE